MITITSFGCEYGRRTEPAYNDWRTPYMEQEDYRIIKTVKRLKYQFGTFISENTSTSFKTYNSEDRLVGKNNVHFYHYDSTGVMIKELYCGRTCEFPIVQLHSYNPNGKIVKITIISGSDTLRIETFEYYSQGMIVKQSRNDSTVSITEYSYNEDFTVKSSVTTDFNSNVKK
ncbi:MAG: hypothetical protein AAGC88_07110 [Bacteroidota bacterium]